MQERVFFLRVKELSSLTELPVQEALWIPAETANRCLKCNDEMFRW